MNQILQKVKSALSFERSRFFINLKSRKTSGKQDGRLQLSYKLEIKPADPPHTHKLSTITLMHMPAKH